MVVTTVDLSTWCATSHWILVTWVHYCPHYSGEETQPAWVPGPASSGRDEDLALTYWGSVLLTPSAVLPPCLPHYGPSRRKGKIFQKWVGWGMQEFPYLFSPFSYFHLPSEKTGCAGQEPVSSSLCICCGIACVVGRMACVTGRTRVTRFCRNQCEATVFFVTVLVRKVFITE